VCGGGGDGGGGESLIVGVIRSRSWWRVVVWDCW